MCTDILICIRRQTKDITFLEKHQGGSVIQTALFSLCLNFAFVSGWMAGLFETYLDLKSFKQQVDVDDVVGSVILRMEVDFQINSV